MSFVVMRKDSDGAPLFWTGRSWCDEYPSALVFRTERAGRKALAKAVRAIGIAPVASVVLVADYGFEHEMVIA